MNRLPTEQKNDIVDQFLYQIIEVILNKQY